MEFEAVIGLEIHAQMSTKTKMFCACDNDSFDKEPNISPELIAMPNVVMTPHIASATREARNKMGEQATSAIIDTLSGKKPQNMVDEKVWTKRRK